MPPFTIGRQIKKDLNVDKDTTKNDRARFPEHNSENRIKNPSGSKVTEVSKSGFSRFLGSII